MAVSRQGQWQQQQVEATAAGRGSRRSQQGGAAATGSSQEQPEECLACVYGRLSWEGSLQGSLANQSRSGKIIVGF